MFLMKQQGGEKKANGHKKKKKAYLAWEENASSTSSNEEEANLCLMVDGEVKSDVCLEAKQFMCYLDNDFSSHMTEDKAKFISLKEKAQF